MDISKEQQERLQQETIDQSKTNMWITSRKVRLTASTTSSVPKTYRADPSRFVANYLYPRFKGTAATRMGTANEPLARKSSWSSPRPTMLNSLEQSFVQQNHTYPPAQMVSSK